MNWVKKLSIHLRMQSENASTQNTVNLFKLEIIMQADMTHKSLTKQFKQLTYRKLSNNKK